MNKFINLPQPYATMVVRGLRKAIPDERFSKGDRIYINALAPKYELDTPLEWFQEVINHQLFGNLPPIEDLPTDKCLGFAEVLCMADGIENRWTCVPEPSVILTNCHEFDELQPIKPREAYEAEDIPSHRFYGADAHIRDFGDELVVNVNDELYAIASKGGILTFELTGSLAVCCMTDEGLVKQFEKFTIMRGNRSKTFLWNDDCDVEWEQDPDTDELVLYPSVFNALGKSARGWLNLSCLYPLIG